MQDIRETVAPMAIHTSLYLFHCKMSFFAQDNVIHDPMLVNPVFSKLLDRDVTLRYCGCVDVWMCGCVGVWICGYMAVWLCGYMDMWICGYREANPQPEQVSVQ